MTSSRALAAGPTVIVALGDSLIAGYGLGESDSLPAQLERRLQAGGRDVRVVNAGVSGDTTAGGRSRLAWVLAEQPRIVLLALGANDGLRGIDPAETRTNLDAILNQLTKRGIKVLLAGMLAPPNYGRAYGQAFNAVFPDLARAHGVAFYPFLLEAVAAQPALNQADGMHPNAQGVAVIADRLAPLLAQLVSGD